MKKITLALGLAAMLVGVNLTAKEVSLDKATLVGDEKISSPYGTIELEHNFITDKSSKILFDAMDTQRASQAYIWSIPLVGMATWQIEQNKYYETGELGVFAVLKSLKEKRGIVTGNLTTPYILSFYDLRKGALVIDYPKGATAGAILDYWQRPVADLGLTGPDKGEGGKYILLGPDDDKSKYNCQCKCRQAARFICRSKYGYIK